MQHRLRRAPILRHRARVRPSHRLRRLRRARQEAHRVGPRHRRRQGHDGRARAGRHGRVHPIRRTHRVGVDGQSHQDLRSREVVRMRRDSHGTRIVRPGPRRPPRLHRAAASSPEARTATIRAWKNAAGDGVVFGRHADTVRGLAINGPAALVLSASHDTTARAWTAAGAVVADFRGHSALVYAVASSVCGSKVITGSEDDTARVWLVSGECVQTIPHPGCVWSVAFLPNADAVTCCADGAVRVWSAETARHDPDAAKSLDDLMTRRTAERAQKSSPTLNPNSRLNPRPRCSRRATGTAPRR